MAKRIQQKKSTVFLLLQFKTNLYQYNNLIKSNKLIIHIIKIKANQLNYFCGKINFFFFLITDWTSENKLRILGFLIEIC